MGPLSFPFKLCHLQSPEAQSLSFRVSLSEEAMGRGQTVEVLLASLRLMHVVVPLFGS